MIDKITRNVTGNKLLENDIIFGYILQGVSECGVSAPGSRWGTKEREWDWEDNGVHKTGTYIHRTHFLPCTLLG